MRFHLAIWLRLPLFFLEDELVIGCCLGHERYIGTLCDALSEVDRRRLS